MPLIRKPVPIHHQGGTSLWRPPLGLRAWLRARLGWRVAATIALLALTVAAGMYWRYAC